jgi:hypothetical protein
VLIVVVFSNISSLLCTSPADGNHYRSLQREAVRTLFLLTAALFFLIRFATDWMIYFKYEFYVVFNRDFRFEPSVSSVQSPMHMVPNGLFSEWLISYIMIPVDLAVGWLVYTVAIAAFIWPTLVFSRGVGILGANYESVYRWKSSLIAFALFITFIAITTLIHVFHVESIRSSAIVIEQSTLVAVDEGETQILQGSVTIKSSLDEILPLLDFAHPTIRFIWPNGVSEVKVHPNDSFLYSEGDGGSQLPLKNYLLNGGG